MSSYFKGKDIVQDWVDIEDCIHCGQNHDEVKLSKTYAPDGETYSENFQCPQTKQWVSSNYDAKDEDKKNPVSIFGCASCGENHKDVETHEFNAPDGEGTVSGIFCPKTGVEVYLYPDDIPDLANKNAFMMWLLSGPPFKPMAYSVDGEIRLILEDCSYGEYRLNDQITLLLRNHTVDGKKAGDICGAIIHFIPDELSY